jgi:hypothetical protein
MNLSKPKPQVSYETAHTFYSDVWRHRFALDYRVVP